MKHVTLLIAAYAVLSGAPAQAQSTFTEQNGLYSLTAPNGWTPYTDRGYADVAYDAPGGKATGGIFSGLKPTERSLSAEMDRFVSTGTVIHRGPITIDGMPCLTASTEEGGYIRKTMILCHFNVRFSDGPMDLEFFLGSASPLALADAQAAVFRTVAASVRWGGRFTPAD